MSAALSPFGGVSEAWSANCRTFVAEKMGCEQRLWDQRINGIYLGSDTWARNMRRLSHRRISKAWPHLFGPYLSIEYPGAVYHVTSRGNERKAIFRTNADREAFLAFLGKTVKRFGWSLTAWVLMTNHFHLVIQTPEPNLSRGMHWLNGSYAGWLNHTRGLTPSSLGPLATPN